MSWRLLLDENIEYEIGRRLREAGYDVQHVARIEELGEGTNDRRVVEYSGDSGRFILTYVDDFLSEFSGSRILPCASSRISRFHPQRSRQSSTIWPSNIRPMK